MTDHLINVLGYLLTAGQRITIADAIYSHLKAHGIYTSELYRELLAFVPNESLEEKDMIKNVTTMYRVLSNHLGIEPIYRPNAEIYLSDLKQFGLKLISLTVRGRMTVRFGRYNVHLWEQKNKYVPHLPI